MKTVVIGQGSGTPRDVVMSVYPRHKALVEVYMARGEIVGIGPFVEGGNMAIFRTRAAAEAFAREDPFFLEGIVKHYDVRDWSDSILP